jgi:activator of HSP90 ATPase
MNPTASSTTTRRRMAQGIALTLGGLASPKTLAAMAQKPLAELAASEANKSRTSLHQSIQLNASPERIYAALLDAKQFASFSGLPAQIDPKAGGLFSMFGGQIVGMTVELVPNQRIVQAWRPAHWNPGVYSMARFELKPGNPVGTTVVLDHTGFPEGDFDSLDWGWHSHYWEPLRKFLATKG